MASIRALLCASVVSWVVLAAAGCGGDDAPSGTQALLSFDGDLTTANTWNDAPFPSDTRLKADGTPDFTGFFGFDDIPEGLHMRDFVALAGKRNGFALQPVVYIRFSAPLAPLKHTDVIADDKASLILLVDIDATSPDHGKLVPLLAETLESDNYTNTNILAVVPYPGFVLRAETRYAALVTTKVLDEAGKNVIASPVLAKLATQTTGTGGVFAPLWPELEALGLTVKDLAAATVFTTGDPFGETLVLSDKALAGNTVEIDPSTIHLTANPEHVSPVLCELDGTIVYPQFQTGDPPFDSDGVFQLDASGAPVKQRDEDAHLTIAIPKTPMPAAGYPIILTIHGTDGYSDTMVAPTMDGLGPDSDHRYFGRGTAFPFARVGLASISQAMPLNEQRIPNSIDTEYVNFNNLPVSRFNLTQGIVESRFLVRALTNVRIPVATLAGCLDPTLLGGATEIKFDVSKLMCTGQSMGGMYASMVTAVEPTINALIPTGGGGYFGLQLLINTVIGDSRTLLSALLRTPPENFTQLHPLINLANMVFEPADPIVFVHHVIEDPAPGYSPRPVLQTSSPVDEYFPGPIYAALAVQYGHPRIGPSLIPEVDTALGLVDRAPITTYPVMNNVQGVTAGISEFPPPDGQSGHGIYVWRDDTRYQMACFFKTYVATGTPVIVEPQDDAVNFACQ